MLIKEIDKKSSQKIHDKLKGGIQRSDKLFPNDYIDYLDILESTNLF